MKFSEKLQKLRKENNLSQEGLADKLDVSRQSVSKWESGQTYPEMDKLLTMCKLFNITLDDLTNDDIDIKEVKTKNKNTFDNLVDDVMYIIDKTFIMFSNMTSKERGKCIGELIILFIILLLFRIPFEYIISIGDSLLYSFPRGAYILQSIWSFIINIIYLILFLFSFLYIYKTYYLDKYKENKRKENEENRETIRNENKEEIKVEQIKTPKTKEKHSNSFSATLFETLGRITTFCVKAFLLIVSLPFIFSFIALFMLLFLFLIIVIKGVFYFGFIICLIAGIILNWLLLRLVASFLFDYKPNFKIMFASFIVGISLIGIGTGLSIFDIASTEYKDTLPKTNLEYTTKELEYDYNDSLVIQEVYHFNKNEYITDETLGNKIKIVANYYKDTNIIDIEEYETYGYNVIEIWNYERYNKEIINLLIKNLKKKEIYNYSLLYKIDIKIYATSENIEKLKNNKNNYIKAISDESIKETNNYYNNTINELWNDKNNLNNEINKLNEKIYNLEDENNRLKEKIQNYKNSLENLD